MSLIEQGTTLPRKIFILFHVHLTNKEKTAFSNSNGLYQVKVMPFELSNTPAAIERLKEQVLKGLEWEICLVYPDDIIVM